MTTDRWRQIQNVFDKAAEVNGTKRLALLDSACAGDAELRREVESLLEVDGQAGRHLAASIQREAERVSSDISATIVGRRIGVYRVTGVLGRGGMGAVYRAVRDDDVYEKSVAIKVVKRGMDTDEIVRRFHQERRILARLDHPNIARLFDGGTTEEGLPYFVMEYVEGKPITEYSALMPLRERLNLFRQVCGAVDYAHRSLVIHRDLKPANILVPAGGEPKLLDFGIAKLLTPEDTSQTMTGLRMLTPDFASPEQKQGEPVTTATDIFSLGRILQAMLPEAAVPAELAQVVAKACHAEPDHRYSSVEQFSEDLRRYVEGLPVLARGDTVLYRTRKFVARNKVAVAAGVIAMVTAGGAAVNAIVQAQRLQRQVQQVRHLATTMLFDVNDEIAGMPGTLKVQEKLVKTGLRYLDGAARDASADETLQWELALGYERIARLQGSPELSKPHLGDIDGAIRSYTTSLHLAEPLLKRDPGNHRARAFLAHVHHLLGFLFEEDEKAATHARQAIDLAAADGGRRELLAVRYKATTQLADLELRAGDPHAALRILKALPATHTPVFWSTASALAATGDLNGAIDNWDRALDATARGLSKLDPGSLTYRGVLRGRIWALMGKARVLSGPAAPHRGSKAAGLQSAREALSAAELNARWDPNEVGARLDHATALLRVAEMLAATPEKAAELYAKSITAMEAFVRPGKSMRWTWKDSLANARWQFARTLDRLNRREEAFVQARQSLRLLESTHARNTLGDLMLGAGDRDGALAEYQRALSFAEARVAARPRMMPWRDELADVYERIARWNERAGDFVTARAWHQKSLAIWKDWRNWGVSSSYDQQRLRQAESAVATCDARSKKG